MASLLVRRFSGCRPRVCVEDLKKRDYRTSMQRIGVHFTERIRDTFRFRWIRKRS
jgi:hypothetical protein